MPDDTTRSDKKRLVVCCDGTWNSPEGANISNIEKLARCVETDASASGGVQQLVEYISGVGVRYRLDRVLGGAFGFGLFNNVKMAYRFIALNYEPGDEIFVFGFSRGAYTARSVAGMIGYSGLLTEDALLRDLNLQEAGLRYQTREEQPKDAAYKSLKEFKEKCCYPSTDVTFVGVFDTVGALGVPGIWHSDHEFHDITIGDGVKRARQALAIDERRMTFAPCLWKVPSDKVGDDRVKQVWFQGAHSDVGGGYPEHGLSDTTLSWMANEASAAGLVFDQSRLDYYLQSGSAAKRHGDSVKVMYRIANFREKIRPKRKEEKGLFSHGLRNLEPPLLTEDLERETPLVLPLALSSTAVEDFKHQDGSYRPENLSTFVSDHEPPQAPYVTEPVTRLPPVGQPAKARAD